ncbi:TonB-dependent receptor [Pseudomaricurvus alkylphenolicus]|jgi:iron complex outermembrane receptor protein|uniref:TonB-dependent receptor n=1 Tax=Pseudomaricurvus alkylphenolicus TaxID=1306991 RepID=UPI0014216646|nr:TonB-dependent receptor [Pseudomaricurvus alkylphenolicus]NIB40754.1 TonB-dependent receptor [Pseudomaricurvus alkylphenolicus]
MVIKNKFKLAAAISCVLANSAVYADGSLIEEVIVTAQKRAQSAQDVPIAITSISGEDMKELGFESAADVQYQTPGLVVSYSSTNAIPNFALRGIGLNDFTAIQSSPVAIHVDEVYYGNSTLLNFALFDVERVEVLKGPQGTLYGRNSTGGAVNFFSNKPTDEFEAGVDFGIARYEAVSVEGYVSGPLSDNVSGRLSVSTVNQNGGPFEHPTLGEVGEKEKYAVRGQLLWDVSDQMTAHLTVFGGKDESDGNQYQGFPTFTNDGSLSICPSIAAGVLRPNAECSYDGSGAAQIDDDDPYTLQNGVINRDEIEAFGSTLSLSYDLGDISITSITGYNTADRKSQEDADGSLQRNIDVGYETDFEQFTEELRFAYSDDEFWTTTLGFFYSIDTLDTPRTETDLGDLFGGFRQNHAYELETESFAVFWHNEFQVRDDLTLIAGIRYTDEERSFKGGTITVDAGVGPNADGDFIASPGPLPGNYSDPSVFDSAYYSDEISFQKVSWRLGFNYDLNATTMLYASIANGFKSGGFVGDITVTDILQEPYDEETLTSYEIGIKSDLLDGSLRWNASAFYYDYEDLILALTITDNPALDLLLINDNGSDAEVYGFESDMWWAPNENLDIKFGFTYLNTEQTALETSPFQVAEDLDGSSLPYAPELSANGLIRYENTLMDSLVGTFQLDFTTRSHHYGEAQNSDIARLSGYTLFNARVGVKPDDGNWSAAVWVKNLTDKQYYQYVNDLQGLGTVLRTPGTPRTFGLDISYTF